MFTQKKLNDNLETNFIFWQLSYDHIETDIKINILQHVGALKKNF